MAIALPLITTLSLQILALTLLSYCRSSASIDLRDKPRKDATLQLLTMAAGLCAGVYTLCLPFFLSIEDPLAVSPIRVASSFYGCKILDLAVVRARKPPTLIDDTTSSNRLLLPTQRATYVWRLLTETRYFSFDIAVRQKDRPSPAHVEPWDLSRLVAIPLLVVLVPRPETKVLLVTLAIEVSLEGIHSIAHPHCTHKLFWRPFAASSLTNFWRTHWHAGAESFLRSLGYEPGSSVARRVGLGPQAARAVGVLAAFSLSGLWHAWAAAALSKLPWSAGFRIWLVFMGMGVGVLLERFIPKKIRGSTAHQVVFWIFFAVAAGWGWRGLQRNVNVPRLANV